LKVLVTGGAGFIGSHVVDGLIEEDHSVVVVDDLSTGRREYVNPQARFYELDIRSPDLDEVFAQERPELVNHHAAQADVRRSMADPGFDAEVNIMGSLNLLECARKHGVKKLIYASTGGAVYGEPVYLPCDEDHPINAFCPYGVSKHTVEHYLYLYGQNYGLEYTILRYSNIYGPRQDPFGEAGVVAIFSRQIVHGEQVVINGSGEQERDFVYVTDIVRANLLTMDNREGQIYNLGCGVGTSINELFGMMKAISGYARDAVHGPPKPGETFRIYLDAGKAHRELGWKPLVGLEEGLGRTIDFFLNAG
jgi:UDP-glucose 4-epimerase